MGITWLRTLVKGFAKSRMNITQKNDIKKPTSIAERGLNSTITNPAMARAFKPS